MKGFFQEANGKLSSLRLNLFLTLLLSIFVTVYQVTKTTVDIGLLALLFGLVFGAKQVDTHLKTPKNGMHTTDNKDND